MRAGLDIEVLRQIRGRRGPQAHRHLLDRIATHPEQHD
jgi:hypothetical protein